jgi:hypothetical protein
VLGGNACYLCFGVSANGTRLEETGGKLTLFRLVVGKRRDSGWSVDT